MATTRNFQAMLNDYLPEDMLREEMLERSFFYNKVKKDEGWKGGALKVPFNRANASSVRFGGLTATADIVQSDFQKGSVDDYVEMWGSLIFNHRDLLEHNGKIKEKSFISDLLPNEIDNFMNYIQRVASNQALSGPWFSTFLTNGGADGTVVVDNISRYEIGMKVDIDDGNSTQGAYFVTNIDLNAGAVAGYPSSGTVTFSATYGGAGADISAFTVAQVARVYHQGVWDGTNNAAFTSLRSALLSATNGGSSTLYGKVKAASPMLQAINISGSGISATNILGKIFDAYTEVRSRARGNATDVLMSFKHLGSIMKILEAQKGPYMVTKGMEANPYGWSSIQIGTVKGTLNLVAIQEMDDDIIHFVDWNSMKFYSNGGFRKRTGPNGNQYFEVRATTGFQYVVDICFFGELVVNKPSSNAVIFGIPAY